MSDASGRGITVTKTTAVDEPVAAAPHTAAAFVGRALRGPLNVPTPVTSFTGFCRRFGGVWSHSSLGPAVQQFFEHGGTELQVVRVANNARGATLRLPAEHGELELSAVDPGAAETLRVSVDYDRLAVDDGEHFNLTVQRLSPATALVIDQEIHRRLSCRPGSRRFVADVLLESALVRSALPVPPDRPLATIGPGFERTGGYIGVAERGTDGDELSDYDLVGSAVERTGMFALDRIESFDLLYLPPPARRRDLGPTAVLAAELYCRKRGAMLIVDPPAAWRSAGEALAGLRAAGLDSANVLGYFPRIVRRDEPGKPARPAGGAIAGLLCKLDTRDGPWQDLDRPAYGLRPGLDPEIEVTAAEGARLVREGLNVIAGGTAGRACLCGGVTLARGSRKDRKSVRLPVRRLCLHIADRVGRATRWAVFQPAGAKTAHRVRAQVHAFLSDLADRGALDGTHFDVQCSSGPLLEAGGRQPGFTILLSFLPAGSTEQVRLSLHQTAQGCRVAATAFAPAPAACA